MLSTLTEITLHNQNIEEIELVGHACRSLQILYLQNNIIGRIKNLHHLKVKATSCVETLKRALWRRVFDYMCYY